MSLIEQSLTYLFSVPACIQTLQVSIFRTLFTCDFYLTPYESRFVFLHQTVFEHDIEWICTLYKRYQKDFPHNRGGL